MSSASSNPACRRSRRPCFHLEVFQVPSQKFSRKFLTRRKQSGQLWRRAARITPGGVESNVRYFKPHPFLADYGDGGYIYDVFFFQAEDGIRDLTVTGVQTCALPI